MIQSSKLIDWQLAPAAFSSRTTNTPAVLDILHDLKVMFSMMPLAQPSLFPKRKMYPPEPFDCRLILLINMLFYYL